MKDLDLTSLRLFVTVCELGSILRASEHENLVPSSVTKRMARLEQDLGTPLLKRVRRGVVPTAAGQALADHARQLLRDAKGIRDEMNLYKSGVAGVVQLMASSSLCAGLLPADISGFLRHPLHGNVRVRLEERTNEQIVKAVREGRIPVGVVWRDAVELSGLVTRPYRDDYLAAVVPQSHPLALQAQVTLAQCLAYDQIGLLTSLSSSAVLARKQTLTIGKLRFKAETSTHAAAFKLVQTGLGIFIAPRETAHPVATAYGLVVVALNEPWARRPHSICFRSEEALPEAARALVEHLASFTPQDPYGGYAGPAPFSGA